MIAALILGGIVYFLIACTFFGYFVTSWRKYRWLMHGELCIFAALLWPAAWILPLCWRAARFGAKRARDKEIPQAKVKR